MILFKAFIYKILEVNNIKDLFLYICLIIVFINLPYLIQLIIHELGHLIFGKITGYSFLLFQIFNIALIKNKSGWKIKRNNQGIQGQCLMIPPKNKKPFMLYNLGGIILNFITAVISIILIKYITILEMQLFLMFVSFYGIGFSIINGIPIGDSDGRNYLALKENKEIIDVYYLQLNLMYEIMNGKTYGDLPRELIIINKEMKLTNPIIAWHKILECYHYMDLNMWDNAMECIKEFEPIYNKLSKGIRNIVKSVEHNINKKQKYFYNNQLRSLNSGRG